MSYTFQSGLAQELQSMIDYKVSLGYSETSYLARSASLDRYCMKYFPEITQLTQDVAIGWLERHQTNLLQRFMDAPVIFAVWENI